MLFEAAAQLGGQVLIGSHGSWRRDLKGIVEWRAAEIDRLKVDWRLNRYAEAEDVLAEHPDVVIVATGGVPDLDWVDGAEYCTSVWDVLTGTVALREDVFVYDGTGRHPAPLVAERAAGQGKAVTFAGIDAYLAAELTYAERVAWKAQFYKLGIPTHFDHRLVQVAPDGNRLSITLTNDVTLTPRTISADQVIVEHGTVPIDEVFQALKAQSANDGVTDIDTLLEVRPQPRTLRPEGRFELHRIGDAVASRNIHAAVLDALRLCAAL